MRRRAFLTAGGGALAAAAAVARTTEVEQPQMATVRHSSPLVNERTGLPPSDVRDVARPFNGPYRGDSLDQIAFPMGGMGAGMVCLEGTGALSKFSLRHRPNLASAPIVFAALSIQKPERIVRLLEGQVPTWKMQPHFFDWVDMPKSHAAMTWGLPRYREAMFEMQFPFANISLRDDEFPLDVKLTGWSPFSPGEADNASLPVAALEYQFLNRSASPIEAVFSFNAQNFMAQPENQWLSDDKSLDRIKPTDGGFILCGVGGQDRPWDDGHCAIWVDDAASKVNHAWFGDGLGLLFDSVQLAWTDIQSGQCYSRDSLPNASPLGASIFVPVTLSPGQSKTIVVRMAWYVPKSNLSFLATNSEDAHPAAGAQTNDGYQPWYAGHFNSIEDVKSYWESQYYPLKHAATKFSQTLYDCTLPPEIVEAVAANLAVLKSPTVLRQVDGRLWAWEGSGDEAGAGGPGSCTHVWAYAQAVAHLFPSLERSLRETELGPNLGKDGFQAPRSALPIRPIGDSKEGRQEPPVGDGQPGGVVKVYRDWRISGNTAWLRGLWPKIRASLDYCISTWDPELRGWIEEPHQTTYDVKFWGADSLCTSLYVGALRAATVMGEALGENVKHYSRLLQKGLCRMEVDLFNGEYFFQRVEWTKLHAPFPPDKDLAPWMIPVSPEALATAKFEGPPYQYGSGCLSDGIMGAWLCRVAGLDNVFDARKINSHLKAVYRYNFKRHLAAYPQVGRSFLGTGTEAGLLVCSWPNGGRPSRPVIYADEVWTGTEYQVASHLIGFGHVQEGLEIVRAARTRYDGRTRNPFGEEEAGQWYARALSSYALLHAFTGARFDAVEKVLYLKPAVQGDFRCFLAAETGYGTVGVRQGRPFMDVVAGHIAYTRIEYVAAS